MLVTVIQRLVLLLLSLSVVACSAALPVSVERLDAQDAYLNVTRTALSSDEISQASLIALRRHDLNELYAEDPVAALEALHEVYLSGGAQHRDLYALAEISLSYADKAGSKPHYLAAAMYAFAQLSLTAERSGLSPVDPRVRVNVDIYNASIVGAFASEDGRAVEFATGKYPLPFGELEVRVDEDEFLWNGRKLTDFLPASRYHVKGLKNRYWRPGVGAALAAQALASSEDERIDGIRVPVIRVPVTALLRFDDIHAHLKDGRGSATLNIFSDSDVETVRVGDRELPLESEPSVALAKTLVDRNPWQTEVSALMGKVLSRPEEGVLGSLESPRKDTIPVVFVHGTGSSSARWVDMLNDIEADSDIHRAFQFWFFSYDSGNPILYSGMQLREALRTLMKGLDPERNNPCLNSMVVIGHSQGGLLVKLISVDSGDAFWSMISDKPFDEIKISDDTRALLSKAMFFEAPSFVDRVVFIATPHRGSYLARFGFVRRLAQRLISIPGNLAKVSADIVRVRDNTEGYLKLERMPTSIDNMSPGSPPLVRLESLPIAPWITANSIIPVLPHDGPLSEGADGVVKYTSAHLDGVESELVVASGHSTQSNPHTISEVLRILRLQMSESSCERASEIHAEAGW